MLLFTKSTKIANSFEQHCCLADLEILLRTVPFGIIVNNVVADKGGYDDADKGGFDDPDKGGFDGAATLTMWLPMKVPVMAPTMMRIVKHQGVRARKFPLMA